MSAEATLIVCATSPQRLALPSATWWALKRLEEKMEQDGKGDGRKVFCL